MSLEPEQRTEAATPSPMRVAGELTVMHIALVATSCAVYSVSQFLRNSVGVIAPVLSADLGIQPGGLGVLSGAFFLSFALAQFPLGIALDRYGPRACMASSIGLAVLGCALFAYGDSLTVLTLARILMGLGCSGLYMGPLTLFSRWFAPRQFSTIVGILLSVGTIGTLLATAPLAQASAAFGWRGAFVAVMGFVILVGIAGWLFLRDQPPDGGEPAPPETFRQGVEGLIEVFRQRDIWPLFAVHFITYASFVTILGLWGAPYLTDIHGASLTERGNYLLVLAAAQVAGLMIWGPADKLFDRRKLPVMVGMGATMVVLTGLAVYPEFPARFIIPVFIVFGLVSAYVPVMTAHGRHLFPQRLIGRGITMLNMAAIGGVFVIQFLSGLIISGFEPVIGADGVRHNSAEAYRACFLFIVACQIIALALYARARESRPSQG